MPHIAEEEGVPPMIDDALTEATVTTIEQHNEGGEREVYSGSRAYEQSNEHC